GAKSKHHTIFSSAAATPRLTYELTKPMTWYTVRPYETGPAGHLYVIQRTDADVPELHTTLLALNGSTCGAEDHAACLHYYKDNEDCDPDTCGRSVLARRTARILERAYQDTGF